MRPLERGSIERLKIFEKEDQKERATIELVLEGFRIVFFFSV